MLNADLLSRISYLIGIFKALNTSMLGRLPTSGCAFQIPTASLAALVLWTIAKSAKKIQSKNYKVKLCGLPRGF
jgi:hypothetical protein